MKKLLTFVVGLVVMYVVCFGFLYAMQAAGYVGGLP